MYLIQAKIGTGQWTSNDRSQTSDLALALAIRDNREGLINHTDTTRFRVWDDEDGTVKQWVTSPF